MKLEFVKINHRYYIHGIHSGRKIYVDPATIETCRDRCDGRVCGNNRKGVYGLWEDARPEFYCVKLEGILEE